MFILDLILKVLGFAWDKTVGLFRSDKPIERGTSEVGVPDGKPTTQNPLKKFPPPVVLVLLLALLVGCAPKIHVGPQTEEHTTHLSTMTKDGLSVEQIRVTSSAKVEVLFTDLVEGKKVVRESKIQLKELVLVRPDIAHAWGLPLTCAKVKLQTWVDGYPLPKIEGKEQVRMDVGGWYVAVVEH